MRNFIKNAVLFLFIFNLFSLVAFAQLNAGDSISIDNSTGVIIPIPTEEEKVESQEPSEDDDANADTSAEDDSNNSNNNAVAGGGSSYKPTTKPGDNTETKPEQTQTENNIRSFFDVEQNDWFYSDVMFVSENKIMTGTAENKFSPDTTLNRAMMITILHRIDGDSSVFVKNIFNDIEKNSWYENAVNWGYENKIVAGTGENTFAPMDNLTREQLCVMLYNYTKHIGVKTEYADISAYSDNEMVSDWAKNAVSWAVQEKIVTGKGNNTLAPGDSATRAEAAAVIRRYTEKITTTGED